MKVALLRGNVVSNRIEIQEPRSYDFVFNLEDGLGNIQEGVSRTINLDFDNRPPIIREFKLVNFKEETNKLSVVSASDANAGDEEKKVNLFLEIDEETTDWFRS